MSSVGFRHGRDVPLDRGLHRPKTPIFFCLSGKGASTTALHRGIHLVKSGDGIGRNDCDNDYDYFVGQILLVWLCCKGGRGAIPLRFVRRKEMDLFEFLADD